ncbi:MAG: hypothetical protein ACPL7D_12000, partial [Candidatus Sumerlaeaceae bacterium]
GHKQWKAPATDAKATKRARLMIFGQKRPNLIFANVMRDLGSSERNAIPATEKRVGTGCVAERKVA